MRLIRRGDRSLSFFLFLFFPHHLFLPPFSLNAVEGPTAGPSTAFWGVFAVEGPNGGPSTALADGCGDGK